MRKPLTSAFALAIALTSLAVGATTVGRSDYRASSDLIADVTITKVEPKKVNGESCGTRFEGSVGRVIKGTHDGKSLSFGRGGSFKVGNRYRVYLVAVKDAEGLLKLGPRDVKEHPPLKAGDLKFAECNGLLPGYVVLHRERIETSKK